MATADNVFISYRRDDAAAYAGRLADRAGAIVGVKRVFIDVEDIRPGQNFSDAIDHTLATCATVLVVIGPRWLDILRERAARHEEDYVVHEISAALARKATVVPVFVGGATAAGLIELPAELADLKFHQAVELRDSSFAEDCDRLMASLNLRRGRSLSKPLLWSAAAAVLIAVAVSIAALAGIGPWRAARERRDEIAQFLQTASTQSQQTQYESAFDSYQHVLSLEPTNRDALDGQVDAAMGWAENFHVLVPEGQRSEDLAGPPLAKLKNVLEAGLSRAGERTPRAADILAHLGWVHWLNEKIAFKEFGGAEPVFRQALAIDASNVYANAMMGNWLLQTHGDRTEAIRHLDAAVKTGQQRPLVRGMQIGGLMYDDDPGMRVEFVKVLNDMRANGEPLDAGTRSRARYLYDVTLGESGEFHDVLTAVPPDENWKTYVWLSPATPADAAEQCKRDFVQASLAEFSGDRTAAANAFKALLPRLQAQNMSYRMVGYAQAAITRLSR